MGELSNLDNVRHELLLSDLRAWNEGFWRNEAAGESRIKFHIALVTAVGGGLGALHQAGGRPPFGPDPLALLVPVALAGLLLAGLVAFARMVRRDEVTDEYKEWSDEIRRHVLGDALYERVYGLERRAPEPRRLSNGGLVATMMLLNALVAGVLAGWLALPAGAAAAWTVGAVGLAGAFAAQREFQSRRFDRAALAHEARRRVRERHRP